MSDNKENEVKTGHTQPSDPTEVQAVPTEPATAEAHDDGWVDLVSMSQPVHQPGTSGGDAGGDDGKYFVADSFSFGVEQAEVDPDLVADGIVGPETDGAAEYEVEMTDLLVSSFSPAGGPDQATDAEYVLEPAMIADYGISGDGAEPPPAEVDEPSSGPTETTDPAGDPTADHAVSLNFARVEIDYLADTEMVELDSTGRLETASLAEASEDLPTEGIGEGGLDELLDG